MAASTPTIKGKEPEIKKVYNPTGREAEVRQHVYDRYYRLQDKRQETEGNWERWQKQWDAFRPPKDADDWRSDIYVPMTTSVIEAQLSEIVEQELRPWVVERGSEDSPKAAVMNAILDYTWDQAKSDLALFDILKDSLIFGTGIGMEYYWKQPRTIKNDQDKEVTTFEYDDCYLKPERLYDFYIDERARDFSGPYQAQDCIHRDVMDYDDFRNFFQGKTWDPMGNAALVKPGGDTNYYEFYKPPERMEHSREVEVLWYWNKPEDLLAIVANDVLVVMKPNPYKHKQLPFFRVIDIRVPYQFYGKGEAELLSSLQEEQNTLRRMIVDRNHLDIDKSFLVSDTLTVEDEDLIAGPHRAIPVGDINQAKPLEYGDIPNSVFKSLELLNDDKIRVTGMDERQQSVSQSGTATEAAILKEATLKRINMKIWQMKKDSLVDIGRLRVANIMQFYSQPKLMEVVDKNQLAKLDPSSKVTQDGKTFQKQYRTVRLKDQAFGLNNVTGQPQITRAKGFTFFEAKPEFFLPSHGGFDIHYKATSQIPLSKPLQQQKGDELYDRLIKNPTVDPWKLAEFELKSREVDPDDFKAQSQQKPDQGFDLEKAMNLAGIENQMMMEGKKVGPTPFAPVPHTEAHIEYMKSNDFKTLASKEVTDIFGLHVTGELKAQEMRGAAGGQGAQGGPPTDQGQGQPPPGQGGQPPSGAAINAPMGNVAPGRMMGGADTQNVSGSQQQ